MTITERFSLAWQVIVVSSELMLRVAKLFFVLGFVLWLIWLCLT